MRSKYVLLAVGAVLFTALNMAVLVANWSITAHAEVAGMNRSALKWDQDFRRAVRDIVEDCHVSNSEHSLLRA